MKEIPWWVWLLAAGGAYYLYSKSSSAALTSGGQIYVPAGTPMFSDSALTTPAGSTSVATVFPAGTVTGNAVQITLAGATATTSYWINQSAATVATPAQIAAQTAGTLT